MRVAFLAAGSVTDRRAWSGTVYYAHRALATRFDVSTVDLSRLNRVLRGARKLVRPSGIDLIREPFVSELVSDYVARQIESEKPEAVFVMGASHLAAGLANRFPVFHCSDATFARMIDYHGEFVGLSRRTLDYGQAMEDRAIRRSAAAIMASEWAAQSARSDYGRAKGVHVVPFGANLDELPSEDVWHRSKECLLLFVGVNWQAKGADVAVEAARLLRARGIPATLHIVGCEPPQRTPSIPFVKLHGFLRKQIPEEYRRLIELMKNADFFILPTRFEAFGIVFCEAAAYGTPSISRSIGGIPTVIDDQVTGVLLDPAAQADAYADRIQEIWSDHRRYLAMRQSAFEKAQRVLNWTTWGDRVESIIADNVTTHPGGIDVATNPEHRHV